MSEIRIDVLRDTRGVDDLRAEWNPLLQASATDSIFLSWEWLSTWWEVLGDGHAPFYVTARGRGGELVGVAPLVIGAGRGLVGRHLRTLMVAGQRAETLSEFLDLFVARGREREIVPLLVRPILEHAGRDWDALVFERVVSCSPNLPLVEEELRSAGLDPTRSPGEASPYLPLPSSWSTLFASMSRNFRSQWSNSMNRLARDGEVRLRVAGRDVPLELAMDRLVELNRARWGATGVSFRSDAYVRFHRLLSRRLYERGALLLVLLDVGDTTVAARYDFLWAGKIWCFQGGWLPAYERLHVGTILTGKVLEWGIENGYREYDFLKGDRPYKRRWASEQRVLVDLSTYARSPKARWWKTVQRTEGALRRHLPRFVREAWTRWRSADSKRGSDRD